MVLRFLRNKKASSMVDSSLYDQETFYYQFFKDLQQAKEEIVIESPFLTMRRVKLMLPMLVRAQNSGVSIVINTRDPIEQEGRMRLEAEQSRPVT
jgi:HKD family nuclease